jgi:hypothetical protein
VLEMNVLVDIMGSLLGEFDSIIRAWVWSFGMLKLETEVISS